MALVPENCSVAGEVSVIAGYKTAINEGTIITLLMPFYLLLSASVSHATLADW